MLTKKNNNARIVECKKYGRVEKFLYLIRKRTQLQTQNLLNKNIIILKNFFIEIIISQK